MDLLCFASCGLEAVGIPHNRGLHKDQGSRTYSFLINKHCQCPKTSGVDQGKLLELNYGKEKGPVSQN